MGEMAENKYSKVIIRIILACVIASLCNILSMITVSKLMGQKLSLTEIYISILWGTLVGSFCIGYWMESKGWQWGILIPVVSMVLASLFHSDKISETILIYVLQLVPAGIVGELGNRMRPVKRRNSNS